MKQKSFKTFVKYNTQTRCNDYILGRISGLMMGLIMCIDKKERVRTYGIRVIEGGKLMEHDCSEEAYKIFTETVEREYPDICIFNFQGDL